MRKTERRSHRGCWVRMEIFVNISIVKSWRVLRRNLKQLIRARVRWVGREDGGELDEARPGGRRRRKAKEGGGGSSPLYILRESERVEKQRAIKREGQI